MYSGIADYRNNSSTTIQDTRGCIRFNDVYRSYYNVYGFCLYTIQSFRDTYNRYPDLITGSSDYNWCYNYLIGRLYNIRPSSNGIIGDLYVYINTNNGRYGYITGSKDVDGVFMNRKCIQPIYL